MFKTRFFTKGIYIPLLLFAAIAAFITAIWFRQGLMYGGAEVGLLTINVQKSLEIQRFIWWAQSAPGMLVPHFITGVSFYFILSILKNIFSPVNLQALIFFCLLFLIGFGMYLFSLSVIGKEKKGLAFLASFYYLFNSYMLVEVWHRFLYTSFFLAAFLPFFVLFWRQWIKYGKFLFLVLFLFTNLTASYMFGNLASIITIWLSLLLISTIEIFFPWKGKRELVKWSFRFSLGAFFWFVTNIWWLIPVFGVAIGVLPQQHSSEDNINTLVNLGKQTILPYSLQFANPFYLFYTSELGQIYSSFFFRIIPWIPIAIIFVGLIVSLKNKLLSGFSIIYLLAIFFSKGAAAPFGYPYIWSFMNFYALGVIRNPFEKLGIMLPFFGSILFILGLEAILLWGTGKKRLFEAHLIVGSTLLAILIFAWPMFSGTVFNKPDNPVLVKVPSEYIDADEWFKTQIKIGNILHLPFSGRDVVTYNWEYGYHGVDINELLFSYFPSITRNLGMKTVDDTLSSITFLFRQPFSENYDHFLKLLQNFDVSFILLHKDVKWMDIATYGKDIALMDPNRIENVLNGLIFLEKKAEFGDLIIYKLKDEYYKPKIILSDRANLIYPGEESFLQTTSDDTSEILTLQTNDFSNEALSKIKKISIFEENKFDFFIGDSLDKTNFDSVMSQLKKMENYFYDTGQLNSQKAVQKIIKATKNLNEINSYESSLRDVFKDNFKTLSLLKLFRSQIANIFYRHLNILEKMADQKPNDLLKILQVRKILVDGLRENHLFPQSFDSYLKDQQIHREIFKLNVPIKSKYELAMNLPNNFDLYPNLLSNLDIRVNSQQLENKGKIDKNIAAFGEFDFDKKMYEVSYNLLESSNLVPNLNQFLTAGSVEFKDNQTAHLSAINGIAYLESPVEKVSGKDIYKISFDASFEKGNEFYVELMQDTEDFDIQKKYQQIQSDECSKHNCYPIKPDSEATGFQTYTIQTSPLNLTARKANIRIIVFSKIEKGQQITGDILIKNLKVNRIFDGNIFLRKNMNDTLENSSSGEILSMTRESPVSYFGKIKLNNPSFLFFKETFHPGWVLTLTQGENKYKINEHFMGNLYANAYFINKVGEYDFKINFEPQKGVVQGFIISSFGWITALLILIWSKFRRRI